MAQAPPAQVVVVQVLHVLVAPMAASVVAGAVSNVMANHHVVVVEMVAPSQLVSAAFPTSESVEVSGCLVP